MRGMDKQMKQKDDGAYYLLDRIWIPRFGDLRKPRSIAVRDGHTIGLSRYAKLKRENLNSPKNVAVRDDRSSATIAVRGVFREQNHYFNRRGTRRCFLCSLRGEIEGSRLKNTVSTLYSRFVASQQHPGLLQACSIRFKAF
ncbi:hypothetical protein E3N88_22710 [Mikania micrantha]|uniref:Uncharacterized protein n=1 Tax=Mikania micrantha TaxID=192012 RepID=A0A5N6NCA4_9ASTR|nr:hypothetical protein E3N88_22710 [Mikania micrantha]